MTIDTRYFLSGRDIALNGSKRAISGGSATMLIGAILCLHGAPSPAADASAAPSATQAVAAAPAGEYRLEKSHASVVLRVNHLGFSTYTTRFSRFDAQLTFDPRKITLSKLVATIETASFEMDAAPQACLDIVKGPQLLDTVKYPQIVFKSERIQMTGTKTMKVFGTLTLHGVTRPIVLTATYNGGYPGMPNMDPHARVGFSAHAALKRSDFGMTFGVPAPGTTMGVGDSIDIAIEAEFSGPALATPAGESH